MGSLIRRRATYETLLAVSKRPVAEIVDGNLYTSPRLSVTAATCAFSLGATLGHAFQLRSNGAAGWWLLSQPELQLGEDILVPDLAGWRRGRLSPLPDTMALDLAPDWICEIVTPDTESLDRTGKLPAYARHGVAHAWLISPAARTLEVQRSEGGRFVLMDHFAGYGRARAEPFGAARLDLSLLWGDASFYPRRRM